MKKFIALIFIAVMFAACNDDNSATYATAGEYDSAISEEITNMQQSLFAVQRGIEDSIAGDEILKKYEAHIDSLGNRIKEMPAYNDDESYRNAAGNLADFYKKSVGTYYRNIANLYKEKNDTSAGTKINQIITQIQEEEKKADEEFHVQRQAFIDKHGVKNDSAGQE